MLRKRRSLAAPPPPVAEKPSPGKRNRKAKLKEKMSPYPEPKWPLMQIENRTGGKFVGLRTVLEFDDLGDEHFSTNGQAETTEKLATREAGMAEESATRVTSSITESGQEGRTEQLDLRQPGPSCAAGRIEKLDIEVSKAGPVINLSHAPSSVTDIGLAAAAEIVESSKEPDKFPTSQHNLKPHDMLALDKKFSPCVRKHVDLPAPVERGGGAAAGVKRRVLKASGGKRDKSDTSKEEGPSSQVKGVWDSVVSWMKMAVDYIALDSPTESLPIAPPHGQKRLLTDCTEPSLPSLKQPRLSNSSTRKKSCANGKVVGQTTSFRGFAVPSSSQGKFDDGLGQVLTLEPVKEEVFNSNARKPIPFKFGSVENANSPTSQLANNLKTSLAIKSPLSSKSISKGEQIKLTSAQHLQSRHFGLNSILDGSPNPIPISSRAGKKKKKIRRQSLQSFYGNSVNSPNLTEVPSAAIIVRRSPRLNGVPPPPPPPPIPSAPPLPPPLPTPQKVERSKVDPSLEILSKMQSRLRSRISSRKMRDKGAGSEGVVMENSSDVKVKQWGEIQARSRKLSYPDFLSLVKEKRAELDKVLLGLQEAVPSSLQAVSDMVEVILEGASWFPGGNKELRESVPLYKSLEKKIETLNEFVQVSKEMNTATRSSVEGRGKDMLHSDLYATLLHMREEFDTKHRHWGHIISTDAESWERCGLPACHALLIRSCDHLCELVSCFVGLCLREASNITGILLSIKCVRTTQLKEKLYDCLRLMNDAHPYFTPNLSLTACSCKSCASGPADLSATGSGCGNTSSPQDTEGESRDGTYLLSLVVQVAVAYVNIAMQQFGGFVARSSRQDVCEHFEGILKLLSLVKSLVLALPTTEVGVVKTVGILTLLPDGQELGGALYDSCVLLIQHIMSQQPNVVASPSSKEKVSKEIVLWMMFSCKYVDHILEFLGSEQASQRGVVNLLHKLQEIEGMLPDY